MAVQSSFYVPDGSTRTFPSTKHIATKQHVGVYLQRALDGIWETALSTSYELVNNSIVFDSAVDNILYVQIEIRVVDTTAELIDSPSNISIVAGNIADVNTTAANLASINTVAANIGAVANTSANMAGLNTIVANIAEILLADDNAVIATTSATNAQLTEWEAEADALTALSYANEAEDVLVNLVTSDGDGTFTYTPQAGVYSSKHYSIKTASMQSVDSISELLTMDVSLHTINVRGYYTANDGGGGIFNYDASQSAVNNGVTIINGWVRQYYNTVSLEWSGYTDLAGAYTEYKGFCEAISLAFNDDKMIEGLNQIPNRYIIGQNKKIYDYHGQEFTIKGASLFDYLFVSQEARDTWNIRQRSDGAGGFLYNVPTGYQTTQFVNPAQVENMIKRAIDDGCNTIRVGVDAAMETTPAQAHPSTGVWYPSDMEQLDTIVYYATKYNLVVLLRQGRADATATQFSEFMKFLVGRYKRYQNVWFNPENEINRGATDGAEWIADITEYFAQMRGAGCTTPIVINTMNYGGQSNWIESIKLLDGVQALARDFGLVLGLHVYQGGTELTGFIKNDRQKQQDEIIPFAYNKYAMFIEEIGINNNITGFEDTFLDNGGDTSVFDTNATKEWMREYMRWVVHQCQVGGMSGCMATTYAAYVIGTDNYDRNTLRKYGRTGDNYELSAWGTIFIERFLKAKQNYKTLSCQCKLVLENGSVRLKPVQGGIITVNRTQYIVPYTDNTIDPLKLDLTGLLDATDYYVFATTDATGTETILKLEAIAVNDAVIESSVELDPISGIYVKGVRSLITTNTSGRRYDDVNDTLVGCIRLVSGAAVDSYTQRLVRSWYNREPLLIEDKLTIDTVPALGVIDGLALEFILFSDEKIEVKFHSRHTPSATGNLTTSVADTTVKQQPEIIFPTTAGVTDRTWHDVIIGDGTNRYHKIEINASGGGTTTFKSGGRLNGIIR